MSQMQLIKPEVNLSTLNDGRGGIFTYFPVRDTINEWSYIVTLKGTDRGRHYHPEFDEYIMFVQGHGCYLEQLENETITHLVGPGDCIYIPKDCVHTFKPLEDCKMIALLTKKWDSCNNPILRK